MTWYSSAWGFEEDENVFAVGMASAVLANLRYTGPVCRSLSPESIEEYELADDSLVDLGVSKKRDSFQVAGSSQVDAAFWMHDDCFFAARATDDVVLIRLIESILSMHSYYLLEEEVDWGQVPAAIMKLVKCGRALRLTSDLRGRRFTVSQKATGLRWRFWKTVFYECLCYAVLDGKVVPESSE